MSPAKWRLFEVAIGMFAESGYANVSVRDIAGAMEINQASIYNHFPSKEAFLTEAFDFYLKRYTVNMPSIGSLSDLLETNTPQEVWDKMQLRYAYDADIAEIMPKILLIAIAERRNNAAARKLFTDVFIDMPQRYIGSLLREMVKQGIIEPLDVSSFVEIYSSFNLCTALRTGGTLEVSTREQEKAQEFLFNFLKFRETSPAKAS